MDINEDLDDNGIFELSRSQILEASGTGFESLFSARGAAGLKRDFAVPADFVDGFTYGIDVSHWQGNINWQRVSDASPEYAYIKATQGATYTDPRLSSNAAGAKANQQAFGCYHFLSANTSLQGQIDNFLRRYEPLHAASNYPPCMDLEWDYNSSGVDRWASKSKAFIGDKALGWMNAIKSEIGVEPVFYTNKSWWESRLGASNDVLEEFGVWMSRYGGYGNDEPPMMSGYKWVMWQFTDRGSINGISGRIDVNLSAPGFLGSSTAPEPAEPIEIPDKPLAQTELADEELAAVYNAIRAKFGSFSEAQFEHLKVLVGTSDPRALRQLGSGNVETPLSESERKKYFGIARSLLGDGSLNQGQFDMLNILLKSASAEAVRRNIIQ